VRELHARVLRVLCFGASPLRLLLTHFVRQTQNAHKARS
jgi:hypothetical protein